MLKNSIIISLFILGFVSLGIISCGQNTSDIILNLDTGGSTCNVVVTIDGGSPVTETTSGNYTVYSNVKAGDHLITVTTPSVNCTYSSGLAPCHTACNFSMSGANHTITVGAACGSSFSGSCD